MAAETTKAPESTAERVALWRALHVLVDPPPYVLEDVIGLQLVDPDDDWRDRPDMDPVGAQGFRTSVISRARFIDDLVAEEAHAGVGQYVILGAGLDTFAQRRPDVASTMHVFEIDQGGPQAWKRERLVDLGFGVPEWLHLVSADFEAGGSWWRALAAGGFDSRQPALVASTGVSMYLTREATMDTLRQLAELAPGSTFAMTFLLPPELLDEADRGGLQQSTSGAKRSGTPFVSFYRPEEMLAMVREAGFSRAQHISGSTLGKRYFGNRADGLRPSTGEDFVIGTI